MRQRVHVASLGLASAVDTHFLSNHTGEHRNREHMVHAGGPTQYNSVLYGIKTGVFIPSTQKMAAANICEYHLCGHHTCVRHETLMPSTASAAAVREEDLLAFKEKGPPTSGRSSEEDNEKMTCRRKTRG